MLRKDGTVFLNYGDCYAGSPNGRSAADTKAGGTDDRTFRDKPFSTVGGALKPKDLVMMPARVALALQADGWWLRSEIVWHKPNPMPESTTDRPTSAHEKVFLLAKSARYFYDNEAVREKSIGQNDHDLTGPGYDAPGQTAQTGSRDSWKGSRFDTGKTATHQLDRAQPQSRRSKKPDGWDTGPGAHGTVHRDGREQGEAGEIRTGRNLRNVWTIATAPYPEAHFATFPPALVEPCVKAGTSEKGCCAECRAPWTRQVESGQGDAFKKQARDTGRPDGAERRNPGGGQKEYDSYRSPRTTGWSPSCACYDDLYRSDFPPPRRARKRRQRVAWGDRWRRVRARPGLPHWPIEPATLLDPFGGSGTVGLVADRLGRDAILIDLNPDYADMARGRIEGDAPLLAEVAAE